MYNIVILNYNTVSLLKLFFLKFYHNSYSILLIIVMLPILFVHSIIFITIKILYVLSV